MKIAFICDSGTARTVQELREQGIFSCPLQISDDQNNYLELEDKTILEIYDKVDNGEMLKTSLPPLGIIDETIQEIKNQGYDTVFCVPICPGLSSTHNAFRLACEQAGLEFICIDTYVTAEVEYHCVTQAKRLYEEKYPGRRVFVINSLSTGPEMKLIAEYIRELILKNEDYETICGKVTEYMQNTGLLFMLESMRNLANNGRINSVVAKAVGLLGIRIVGQASEVGDLQLLDKCRGQQKALEAMFNRMKEFGFNGGRVRLAHCFNEKAAETLKNMILTEFPASNIEVYTCRGLCGFYAEKGGMLVGYEKNIQA